MSAPLSPLKTRWAAMAPRERRMVGIAAALVALALLWWVALGPALRTLAAAPAEHARLDAELQKMSTLQARARALQALPRANRDDALRALDSSVRESLGPGAQLLNAGSGDAANVTLRGASAEALAQWLAQARANARAVPREAHLSRATASPASPTPTTAGPARPAAAGTPAVRWEGNLVMTLPAASR
ncbi:MAG: type II secretion system protein M [Variovorax sp.]|nr:MAG: type II secretion system protein M [Variovorax sp.]